MKKLLILVFTCAAFPVFSQDAEVLHIFDSTRADIQDEFLYIEPTIDLTTLTHVALVQVSHSRADLENLYTFCRRQASELGANGYRIRESEHTESGLRIILDLYYVDKVSKENIRAQQPKNIVFVFGSDEPGKTSTCKVDNKKIELPPFTFYQQENKPGGEIKVSKGGITGMAVWITWAQNKPARYITLSGFGLSGVGIGPGVGAGFNTGRLAYVEPEAGRFLSVLMKPITRD